MAAHDGYQHRGCTRSSEQNIRNWQAVDAGDEIQPNGPDGRGQTNSVPMHPPAQDHCAANRSGKNGCTLARFGGMIRFVRRRLKLISLANRRGKTWTLQSWVWWNETAKCPLTNN